jgi:hypothetical protein
MKGTGNNLAEIIIANILFTLKYSSVGMVIKISGCTKESP